MVMLVMSVKGCGYGDVLLMTKMAAAAGEGGREYKRGSTRGKRDGCSSEL